MKVFFLVLLLLVKMKSFFAKSLISERVLKKEEHVIYTILIKWFYFKMYKQTQWTSCSNFTFGLSRKRKKGKASVVEWFVLTTRDQSACVHYLTKWIYINMGAQFFSLVLRRFPRKPGLRSHLAFDHIIERIKHYQPIRSEWWSGTEKDENEAKRRN